MSDVARVLIHIATLAAIVALGLTGHEQLCIGLTVGTALPSPVSTAIRLTDPADTTIGR